MSEYTISVKEILNKLAKDNNIDITGKKPQEIIELTKSLFFDFDYPIWTDGQTTIPDYKPTFETMFLKNFYLNEICYEDYDEWNMELDGTLNLIMPYYNHLLQSETWFDKYITNPSNNTDYTESYTKTNNDTDTTHTTSADTSTGKTIEAVNNTVKNSGTTTINDTGSNNSTSKTTNTGDTSNSINSINNDLPKSSWDDGSDYATNTSTNVSSATTSNQSQNFTDSTSLNNNITSVDTTTESDTNDNSTFDNSGSGSVDGNRSGTGEENYEFHRVGNIGIQTPGEVFEKSRLAFINTMRDIFNDEIVKQLFILIY